MANYFHPLLARHFLLQVDLKQYGKRA